MAAPNLTPKGPKGGGVFGLKTPPCMWWTSSFRSKLVRGRGCGGFFSRDPGPRRAYPKRPYFWGPECQAHAAGIVIHRKEPPKKNCLFWGGTVCSPNFLPPNPLFLTRGKYTSFPSSNAPPLHLHRQAHIPSTHKHTHARARRHAGTHTHKYTHRGTHTRTHTHTHGTHTHTTPHTHTPTHTHTHTHTHTCTHA